MRLYLGLLLVLGWGIATSAAAFERPQQLAVAVGYFDVSSQSDPAVEGRLEARWAPRGRVRPFAGVMATGNGAAHGFAGVLTEVDLSRRSYLALSFAPGLFHNGRGKDLGHAVQFRSQIELGLRLRDGTQIGFAYNHVSNAGLGRRNPGAETLALVVTTQPAFFERASKSGGDR